MHRLCIAAVLLCLVATVNADTLILRDGRRIQGRLISFQNGVVEFEETGFGGRLGRVNRDEVTGIEFGRVERDEPPQTSQGRRPRGLREKQVTVVANAAWSDTGIDVNPTNHLFGGERRIRWGPNRRAVRTANRTRPTIRAAHAESSRRGAHWPCRNLQRLLLCRDDRGPIRIRSSGRLFLGINDDNLQDNTGYFRVIVYY